MCRLSRVVAGVQKRNGQQLKCKSRDAAEPDQVFAANQVLRAVEQIFSAVNALLAFCPFGLCVVQRNQTHSHQCAAAIISLVREGQNSSGDQARSGIQRRLSPIRALVYQVGLKMADDPDLMSSAVRRLLCACASILSDYPARTLSRTVRPDFAA
jgi:hypothetical protein